ncbi:MAG: DNA topoisomerase IB [Acidimicrobiia bacterium]|nr:DNA topoisomerase IB [Acidimicrobiia bacterium]
MWPVPRLRRVTCNDPGYTRRRAGRGFVYLDLDGNRLADADVLARVRSLAIPPAWTDVWICADERGHLQAVGTDAAGRRQYLYHPAWRQRRDRDKFDHMLVFGRALPRIRRQCAKRLARADLDRDRVLACAVRLLDLGFFRIGTEGYAEQHQHYGLATMQKRHVRVDGDVVTFDFVAKSGKRRVQSVVDPAVHDIVSRLKRRRGGGDNLLVYKQGGRWRNVRSTEINEFIKEISGDDFSAKDFRTWSATVLAAVALAVSTEAAGSSTARRRATVRAMKEVAHYLGNTPAVCRSSYVDPRLVDRFEAGITVAPALTKLGEGAALGQLAFQGAIERAVLDLLDNEPAGTVRVA